ncbi:MAG: hypothetical protein A2840_02725 [Candidatus Buchananbacteria bacterium RIFCSPHIGHO2_01_FULL_47_11b]|uniref:Acylneuraminate cytidylyltransferase n=1 Tax=Candidatus Buchananbacteria bacterium RIFCSPHIGHO2_01_FULL_47_11b TaxID=1797537 RepID=A0A1G1Y3D4_9BACT|nr:MAG: hypothetical protein A2840_02725 [Candidatus Buchananbacteria bacterium RIFCSPHIGHO2_01_FULL_47_11b]
MNVYTVIPARAGSKSIPKKNIRLLNGKPLIQYSIDYSLRCPLIARTIVSTDSEEIATIARAGGALVPFIRPNQYAQDDTPDYPVMRHALEALEKEYKETIDVIVLLRPTSPFRPAGLIEQSLKLFEQFPEATSIRAMARAKQHPYRQWKRNGDYVVGYEQAVKEPYNIPRQQLPEVFFQTGDIELVRRETLLGGSVSGDKVLPLEINQRDVVDIDSLSDWEAAERKAKA